MEDGAFFEFHNVAAWCRLLQGMFCYEPGAVAQSKPRYSEEKLKELPIMDFQQLSWVKLKQLRW